MMVIWICCGTLNVKAEMLKYYHHWLSFSERLGYLYLLSVISRLLWTDLMKCWKIMYEHILSTSELNVAISGHRDKAAHGFSSLKCMTEFFSVEAVNKWNLLALAAVDGSDNKDKFQSWLRHTGKWTTWLQSLTNMQFLPSSWQATYGTLSHLFYVAKIHKRLLTVKMAPW